MALKRKPNVTDSLLRLSLFLAIHVSLLSTCFAKDYLTITSDPPGASIEINGRVVGKTPYKVEVPKAYYHGCGNVFCLKHALVDQLHARIMLDGFLPKDQDLARGPYKWIAFNGTYHGDYFLLQADTFNFTLEKASTTFTGSVQATLAGTGSATMRPALSSEEIFGRANSAVLLLSGAEGHGSGFLVSDTGIAVTNAHVAKGQSNLTATTGNGQTFNAKVEYIDPNLDIAFVRVEGSNFPHLTLAEPLRTIDDIVALHELEGKEVQEVFVEGLSDKHFFEHFLIESGLPDVAVYEIATVEVPTGEVLKRALEDGNKGRVVTLACLLDDEVEVNEVVCIADADFDYLKGTIYDCSLLLLSDYSALEMYAFNERALAKLFRLVANGFPKRPDIVMTQIRAPLETAFLIRMANQDLGLGCAVPDLHDFCAYNSKKDNIEFREKDYIATLVRLRPKEKLQDKVKSFVLEQRPSLKHDARYQIHGHDFSLLLGWFIRQHHGFKAIHPTTISASLTACIECTWLTDENLFVELLKRLKS